MTIQQADRQLLFQLFHIYEEREAKNIADLVMENVTEWKRIDRVMNKELVLSGEKEHLLDCYIIELLQHRPVQYVLNEAWFYGMKLYVDERVLIPRPETEELLNWLAEDLLKAGNVFQKEKETIKVLDIGTGSGCIALGLKQKLPRADVYACDVSEAALAVAKMNAVALNVRVNFIQCDFLENEATDALPKVDIIISNPPYIPLHEKSAMHPNVLLHEPHLALFVEDRNPLIFYQAIASFAKRNLTSNGAAFVEIHEQMGDSVNDLFIQNGFESIQVKKDLQGKDRMIRVTYQNRD